MFSILMHFLHRHARQILLYILSGGIAASVDFGGYSLLIHLGVWYLHASILSTIAAFFTTFLLNKYVVFRKKGVLLRHLIRFTIVDLINTILSNVLLYCFVTSISIEEHIAKIAAMGVVVLWNFFIYKFVVYV